MNLSLAHLRMDRCITSQRGILTQFYSFQHVCLYVKFRIRSGILKEKQEEADGLRK